MTIKEMILHLNNEYELFIIKHAIWNAKHAIGITLLEDKDFNWEQYKKVMHIMDEIANGYQEQENNVKGKKQ